MEPDRNARQSWYGEAYVRALAFACGLVAHKPEPDVLGVDLEVGRPGLHGRLRHPRCELQVKSHANAPDVEATWAQRLDRDHFVELATEDVQLPRYLVVVRVPEDEGEWVEVGPEDVVLRRSVAGSTCGGGSRCRRSGRRRLSTCRRRRS